MGFGTLLRRLAGAPASPERDDDTARWRAAAMLLLEAARADFSVDDAERRSVERILVERAGLDAAQAAALCRQAGLAVEQAISLHDAIQTVNAGFDPEQRRALLRSLWDVVLADGRIDPHEEALLRRLAELMHLSHDDFVRTRLAACGERP